MGDVSITMSTLDSVRYAVDLQPYLWKGLPQELSVQNGSITEENYFPVLNYPNMDLQYLPKWDGERELLFSAAHRKRLLSKDATGALKMWLRRHKKNPYPSKAEKIMLAILSRMTLTQVSTWFANARRRLKKDFPNDDDDVVQSNDSSELLSDMCYYKNN